MAAEEIEDADFALELPDDLVVDGLPSLPIVLKKTRSVSYCLTLFCWSVLFSKSVKMSDKMEQVWKYRFITIMTR